MFDFPLHPAPPYAALVFDCDGTLVDTTAANESAWRTALAEWDVDLDAGWYRARTGLPGDLLMTELKEEIGREFDETAVRTAALDAYSKLVGTVEPHAAVVAVARAYHGRVPLAVASGGSRRSVEESLRATGLRPLFDAVITRDDVRYGKPAPDVYVLAAEQLEVSPARCVAYEDTDEGITAALAAGMRVIDVRPSLGRDL
jgi:HAD superfamily hydrolase (TIGR01509 family)